MTQPLTASIQPYNQPLDPSWHLVTELRPVDFMGWAKQYTFGDNDSFNGTQQEYKPANVYIDPATGDLIMEAHNTGGGNVGTGKYTSGMVASWNALSYKYGYVEGKLKPPGGTGVWPAFWQLLTTVPQSNEYDILEIFETPTILHRGIHYENPIGTKQNDGGQTTVVDMTQTFHYYALQWTPSLIAFYFDGALIFSSTSAVEQAPGFMYILMNLAIGGIVTTGLPPDSVFPIQYRCEYIRLWQRTEPDYLFQFTPQAPSFGNYKAAILNYVPGTYYKFDETSGTTAIDSSGNGNNATYNGGFTLNQPSLILGDGGKSVKFNGSTGYVHTTFDPTGLTKLSAIGTFTMPSVISNDGRLAASDHASITGNGFEWVIRANGVGGLVSVGYGTGHIDCYWSLPNSATLQANTTYQYGWSYDGQYVHVYINGALVGTANATSVHPISSSGLTVDIARGPYGGGNDYAAINLDELAFFPGVVLAAGDFLALSNRATVAPAVVGTISISDTSADNSVHSYALNTSVRLAATFSSDPTVVRLLVLSPSGIRSTFVYATDAELEKDGTGQYHLDLLPATPGVWAYRFEAEGVTTMADESLFFVRPSAF